MLTVNYKSLVLFSYLKLALENHKLNNELCDNVERIFPGGKLLSTITQRFAVT
ncbi:uncharacterized protein METZ01_LOCUS55855 [marine metagenome]|uniref:Uncharacterized protein n=1 Tax=marine metagenome TaxID=408172 RepID=A0A381SI41_9ZZZZ